MVIAHPPMAQFDGIAINIRKNQKIKSDVNIHKLLTICVQLNGNLYLTRLGKGNGYCNGKRRERRYHFPIRYNVKHLKDPKNRDISCLEVWRLICLLK